MPKKPLKSTLILVGLLLSSFVHAQQYGFEWIKPYQPYYKFKVGKTATYKIDAAALQQAGVNVATVNPKRIQLFAQGKEVPIYIAGESDEVFNTNDYIEFVGIKNNGNIDEELYANPNWQPNTVNGLFTDTAVYFLTILPDTTAQQPLRLRPTSSVSFSGLTPESYFMDTVMVAPAEEYLDGPDLMNANEKYVSSEYEEGEGWASDRIGLASSRTWTLATPFYAPSGPAPAIAYKIIGASNARTSTAFNHHVQVAISNNNSSFTTLSDQTFYGYAVQSFSPAITGAMLGSPSTYLRVSTINDLSVLADYNCLSFIQLVYPRSYNLSGEAGKWLQVTHQQGGAHSYVQLQNSGAGSMCVFDVTANARITARFNAGTGEFTIPNDGKPHQLWVYDSTQVEIVSNIQPVQFPAINPALNYEFIIISHPTLEPAANNYKDYRSLRYNTIKLYSEQLYDYYFYGNKHPLAVRRLMKHLLIQQTVAPKYLLLAGRGYQNDKARFKSISSTDPELYYNRNLVPAIGVPGADALFSSGIKGDGFYAEVPTGRIPATTSEELQNYLNKLIVFETDADSISPWRKRVLHVSGGAKESEQVSFRTTLNNNAQVIRGQNLGATVKSYGKTTNSPTQADLRDKIMADQNAGVNMLSFLGHASLSVLDVDIGTVNELEKNRRYPLYYFSGCNVGNATEADPQTNDGVSAKDYICTAERGAIGWLAHSNFTFEGFLPPIINSFYQNYTQTSYGRSIGYIVKEVTRGLSNGSPVTRSHNIQWMLQGDPAVSLYSPSAPDYAITQSDVFVKNTNFSTQDEYIDLGIIINNLGKATTDSFSVSVSRRFPDNQVKSYPMIRSLGVYNQDTLSIRMEMLGELALGKNVFEIKIDALNEVAEIAENNNTVSVDIFVPGNGSSILYPTTDALVGNDTIWLTVQNNNILSTQNEFYVEVDTTESFNSPARVSSGLLKTTGLLRWPFVSKATDTTTYYWRTRLNLSEQQGGRWVNSVFCYIPGHEEGWMQHAFARKIDLSGSDLLLVDTPNQVVDFSENSTTIELKANRLAHGGRGLFYDGENQNPGSLSCTSNGFFAVLIDKRTLRMFINPRFPMNCANVITNNQNPALRKLYYYGFPNTLAGQQEFQRFVDSLDQGTYVAIWSVYDNGNANWTPAMRSTFAKLGSLKVAGANNPSTVFTMVGVLGATPGTIAEDTLTWLGTDSNCVTSSVLKGKWYTAGGSSLKVGPAQQWKSVAYYFNPSENNGANDFNKVNIYGITADNRDTLLIEAATQNHDISGIDASRYPFLRLTYTLFDTLYRTPDQLNYWMVKYTPAAEGTISVGDGFSFYNPELEQGDSMRFLLTFRNVSKATFDSVPLYIRVLDANRVLQYEYQTTYGRFNADELIRVNHAVSTYNLSGQHSLEVYFNDGPQPELTKVNNYLFKSFKVKADVINPVLDVTFDGYRIINGDFVSTKPVIRITSKDDSKFKLQNDTGSFLLFLRKPGQTDFERITLADNVVRFVPAGGPDNKAMLEYKPELNADGLYTLKVLSKDASGNLAGSNFYEIDFNVLGKSTITNFFPYPNPATTNVRFVFTLTGSVPPDQLLIRIMTISGKVVKEINKDEFGPIKIGQNMSEFAWDGTDNYGDRLANGVYLYQVFTRINGSNIEKRQTQADQYFLENVGKIYLMK